LRPSLGRMVTVVSGREVGRTNAARSDRDPGGGRSIASTARSGKLVQRKAEGLKLDGAGLRLGAGVMA